MARRLVPRDERTTVNVEFASIDELITEYVSNISRSGVFIRSKNPLPVGTKVDLKFTVILDDVETIEGIGEVVRVSQSPKGMGVVFISLSSVSQTLVGRVLTRRAEGRPRRRTTPPPPPGKPLPGKSRPR
jgi:hypothetical protein